ncbi:hypothetical protein [uncultured Sulfitobacter sp.]|uniref:hypothetical protein n=1 Tax=uncultured Sulfitobacter sp. TaxID=191468 RepID=UPI0030D71D68|tara:strand:+ start:146365 stop:146940 length:576 start_codon:yes stop_codon:yes gene_type:complete
MTAGIGHNNGPSMEAGHKWRSFQWQKAREAAMPKTIPLMVVKMRVKRARELGLDYKAYAAIRQATGRDILALLFSNNALRVVRADAPQMPVRQADVLTAVQGAQKLALVHRPLVPARIGAANPALDFVDQAPKFTDSWSDMRDHLNDAVQGRKLAGDQVLIIGDTAIERDWSAASKAAGYLAAGRYFGAGA